MGGGFDHFNLKPSCFGALAFVWVAQGGILKDGAPLGHAPPSPMQ